MSPRLPLPVMRDSDVDERDLPHSVLSTRHLRMAPLHGLFRAVAAGSLLGALAACGGGGSGGAVPTQTPSPTPAPTPSPSPASGPIDAVLSVPDPVGYDSERLAVFNRLNQIRLSAGLGMLTQQVQMDQAAQAHAEWEVANNLDSHDEISGTPGFTGVKFWNRDEAVGYLTANASEVMCNGAAAASCVELLVNGAYHRAAMLAFEPVDVGIGRSSGIVSNVVQPIVVDMASPGADPVRGLGQLAQTSIAGVAIWPLDGAAEVPLLMGREYPNPVPAVDVRNLGTPVSISVAQSRELSGNFTLTKSGTDTQISMLTLDRTTDSNGLIPPSYIVAVPLAPLEAHTTYAVTFRGTVAGIPAGSPVALTRSWTFTTAAQ